MQQSHGWRDETAPRLLAIATVLLLVGFVLRWLVGQRWFDFYGAATLGLIGALPVLAALMRGLERRGRPRWLAWLLVAPPVVAAFVQIGFWTAFFSSTKSGIPLGLGRLMLSINAGSAGLALVALYAALFVYVIWRAIGPPRRQAS